MTTQAKPSRLDLERELIWRRCKTDPWYFILNYVQVKNPRGAYEAWNAEWLHQGDITRWMHGKWLSESKSMSGALKARQVGWTTIAHAFVLWDIFFHDYHDWLSVSVGEDEAKDALASKVKAPYERLPSWMLRRGPQIKSATSQLFAFENGSSILAIPSTERSGRSRAVYGALFDEAAFMEDAGAVFAGVEPTVYGPLFMFSTANGMGDFFHDTWVESLADDSEWDMSFYPWSVVPGRTEAWYETQKLTYRTQPHLFYQEYPNNPTEAFLKSGRTAFDIEHLTEWGAWSEPAYRHDVTAMDFHRELDADEIFEYTRLGDSERADLELWVWEYPTIIRGPDGRVAQLPSYSVGVDVSEGLAHGDFSAVEVRNLNTGEQVATMRAHIPIYELGPFIELVGYLYFTALIGVERNSFGLVPLEYLQNRGYPRIYRMDPIAELKRGQRSPRYGWLTTRTTKPKMVQDMVKATVHEEVILHDRRWLQEASTFISTGTGRYEASASNTDDLLMASLVNHQVSRDIDRFPVVWEPLEVPEITFRDVFGDVTYAGDELVAANVLDQPIGQAHEAPVRVSFRR